MTKQASDIAGLVEWLRTVDPYDKPLATGMICTEAADLIEAQAVERIGLLDIITDRDEQLSTAQATIGRYENTLRLSHHFWLQAAEEALQGDLGKLRRHVAVSKDTNRDAVIEEMGQALSGSGD